MERFLSLPFMTPEQILEELKNAVETAQNALKTAEKLLSGKVQTHTTKAIITPEDSPHPDEKTFHGFFDGRNMITDDGTAYPVPANYASKSKLVEGDQLKLSIQPSGAYVYKQVHLVERELKKGHLILDDGEYKVLCEGTTYDVLYASVTFFRAKVGDQVTIFLPRDKAATWAAIENIIPSEVEA